MYSKNRNSFLSIVFLAFLIAGCNDNEVLQNSHDLSPISDAKTLVAEIEDLTRQLSYDRGRINLEQDTLLLRLENVDSLILGDLFVSLAAIREQPTGQGLIGHIELLDAQTEGSIIGVIRADRSAVLVVYLSNGQRILLQGQVDDTYLSFSGEALFLDTGEEADAFIETISIQRNEDPLGDSEGQSLVDGARRYDLLKSTTRVGESFVSFTLEFAQGGVEVLSPEGFQLIVDIADSLFEAGFDFEAEENQGIYEGLVAETLDDLDFSLLIYNVSPTTIDVCTSLNEGILPDLDNFGIFNITFSAAEEVFTTGDILDPDGRSVAKYHLQIFDNRIVISFPNNDIIQGPFQYFLGLNAFNYNFFTDGGDELCVSN